MIVIWVIKIRAASWRFGFICLISCSIGWVFVKILVKFCAAINYGKLFDLGTCEYVKSGCFRELIV
jgi:hypothetical protein